MVYSGFLFFALLGLGQACLPNIPNPCTIGVETTPYTSSYSGTPVPTSQLSCTFDGPCCWDLQTSNNANAKVITKPGGLLGCLAGATAPNGPFLGVFNTETSAGQVIMSSCPTECTESSTLEARIWKSPGASVRVCQRKMGTSQLLNCVPFNGASGTIGTFNFPKMENYQYVIEGSGISGITNYVGLDDIKVSSTPCVTTTTSTTTTTTTTTSPTTTTAGYGNACSKLVCNSASGICDWENNPTPGYVNFDRYPAKTLVGNMDTGVNAPGLMAGRSTWNDVAPEPFIAASHGPYEKSAMAVIDLDIPRDMLLKMKVYDACYNYNIEGCIDDPTRCTELTNKDVKLSDRLWRDATLNIPAGTYGVLLKATNHGNYYCSAGIGHFELFDAQSGAKIC